MSVPETCCTVTSQELMVRGANTISPHETVIISDLDIRIHSLALFATEIWIELHEELKYSIKAEGSENTAFYDLKGRGHNLILREGWLNIVWFEQE